MNLRCCVKSIRCANTGMHFLNSEQTNLLKNIPQAFLKSPCTVSETLLQNHNLANLVGAVAPSLPFLLGAGWDELLLGQVWTHTAFQGMFLYELTPLPGPWEVISLLSSCWGDRECPSAGFFGYHTLLTLSCFLQRGHFMQSHRFPISEAKPGWGF